MGLGFSAGALVAWRFTWTCKELHLGSLLDKQGRACFAEIRLAGGLRIASVSLYCWVGVGPAGANLDLLDDMARALQSLSLPFVVLADWNMEPAELRSTGWISHVDGGIVAQPGFRNKCTAGEETTF